VRLLENEERFVAEVQKVLASLNRGESGSDAERRQRADDLLRT
jgi:hypothetical protein